MLLRFVGRITLGRESQQIEWKVADLNRDKARRVIFDLSGVTFMDSTGIGIVVMCSGKLKDAGGQLRLSGASGIVDQTLRMTGIQNLVPFHTTIDEGRQRLWQRPAGCPRLGKQSAGMVADKSACIFPFA